MKQSFCVKYRSPGYDTICHGATETTIQQRLAASLARNIPSIGTGQMDSVWMINAWRNAISTDHLDC